VAFEAECRSDISSGLICLVSCFTGESEKAKINKQKKAKKRALLMKSISFVLSFIE